MIFQSISLQFIFHLPSPPSLLNHIAIHSSSTSFHGGLPHRFPRILKQEAINASTKVRHLKSTTNAQSVIDFLTTYDLSKTQIKSIVISQPNILLRKVDKTLDPKFKILHEIGLSGSDLIAVIIRDPNLLTRGLHTSIIPAISYLRKIFGSDEKIVKVMKRSHWPFYGKSFRTNMMLLERFGVLNKDIERVIMRNPRLVTQSPVRLEEKLISVEREFGIMRGSAMFSYGLSAICSLNKLNLQKKFEVFKRFGWSDSDIYIIVKSQPVCLTHSEERLSKGLNFFMKELGFTPFWLATRGSLLMYSLEKRVKPRFKVFKVSKENGVISKKFQSILGLSDVDFLEKIVRQYKEEIPDELYASFTSKKLKL